MEYYKVYFTYDAETIGEDGEKLYVEFDCTEEVDTLEELEKLLTELKDNHCFDICWRKVARAERSTI